MIVILKQNEKLPLRTSYEAFTIVRVLPNGRVHVEKSRSPDPHELDEFLNTKIGQLLLSQEVLRIMLS